MSAALQAGVIREEGEQATMTEEDFKMRVEAEGQSKAATLDKIYFTARSRSRNSIHKGASSGASLSPRIQSQDSAEIPIYPTLDPEEQFQRIIIDPPESARRDMDSDTASACRSIDRALSLRDKYQSIVAVAPPPAGSEPATPPPTASRHPGAVEESEPFYRREAPSYDPFLSTAVPTASDHTVEMVDGVYHVFEPGASDPMLSVPNVAQFYVDYFALRGIVNSGPVKTFAYRRLQILEERFSLHVMLNGHKEGQEQKSVPHRDFYNVRKVDTHVHHSACMNQKHLLRFIKSKLKKDPDEIVTFRDGRFLTLTEVFDSLHLTAYDLSVDTLDMHAHNTFHRFDRFNLKYNPAGQSKLREIFMKTDNLLAGQYLAEITKEVIADLEASKYQLAEWRVSIYGRKLSEWDKLARWFFVNKLANPCIRWLIQVPRLYHIYKRSGEVQNFQDMISNIFAPLYEVTRDPSSNMHLHVFLQTVVGFDSVDDESKPEPIQPQPGQAMPLPSEWTSHENPPYSYWTYYMYANLATLNAMRASRGLNTFEFRPHCGEAGDVDHLTSCYLAASKINHGILLRKSAGLQYLYYLSQIGVAMSPLSNNKLFLDYNRNPFPQYFSRGLNVSLSTDDPLMLHYTKDALLEEYSVAAQVWKLSSVDQCEIARNSVLQSGFEPEFKSHFLGSCHHRPGALGNDIRMTNVPNIRLHYRSEMLMSEMKLISRGCASTG